MRTHPLLRWAAIALLMFVGWPVSPARADPARPGNTVSEVETLNPAAPGVIADIVGGDAFLRLRVSPGLEVRVPGYLGEPYLWIRSDGTVWRNVESPATALNEDRYITGDTPDVTTRPGAPLPEPDWQPYGDAGEVLWHDHRVHWMGSGDPPTIDPDGLVQRWDVPIEVDGQPVTITGGLFRRSPASSAWWAVAVVGFAAAMAASRRSVRVTAAATAAIGLGVAAVGWGSWWALPAAARSAPAIGVLAIGAVMAAGWVWLWRAGSLTGPLLAGAGTALLLAGWLGRQGITAAVVPGLDDAWMWRVAFASGLGVGAAALAIGVRRSLRPAAR